MILVRCRGTSPFLVVAWLRIRVIFIRCFTRMKCRRCLFVLIRRRFLLMGRILLVFSVIVLVTRKLRRLSSRLLGRVWFVLPLFTMIRRRVILRICRGLSWFRASRILLFALFRSCRVSGHLLRLT